MQSLISEPESRAKAPATGPRLGTLDLLVLSAWCGLVGGWLEVAARVGYRVLSPVEQLYLMTRHFAWLVPLVDLSVFLAIGATLAIAARRWPRRAGWWAPRLIIAIALLPSLGLAGRGIYMEAWVLFALGVAVNVAPILERHPAPARRRMALSLPILLAPAPLLAGWMLLAGPMLRARGEVGRPLPSAGSPNVLLIVLDTVRADHLSLYGYPRPTTPHLERLARRGIRFDRARSAAPWTLASHLTMFTGRWPHELGIDWTNPPTGDAPRLAEHLGSLGYATAGFAGNTVYCSYDTGLDRGFGRFDDYALDRLSAARSAKLVSEAMKGIGQVCRLLPVAYRTRAALAHGRRKDAAAVNRQFLGWLSGRREPGRPFFAFLNYIDAHSPYILPEGASPRFSPVPMHEAQMAFLDEGWNDANRLRLPGASTRMVQDAYDNCLAYLDDRLGELLAELQARGVLDRTLLIITADHGEALGEHTLFDHGESLYRPEIRVPLVIVPPAGPARPSRTRVVDAPVSLRDIAVTVAEFVSPRPGSSFPGRSLLGRGGDAPPGDGQGPDDPVLSELETPNPSDPNRGRSPGHRGPLASLAEGDLVYIRNEGDGGEELFDDRADPHERVNLARREEMAPVLRRLRDRLRRATGRK